MDYFFENRLGFQRNSFLRIQTTINNTPTVSFMIGNTKDFDNPICYQMTQVEITELIDILRDYISNNKENKIQQFDEHEVLPL